MQKQSFSWLTGNKCRFWLIDNLFWEKKIVLSIKNKKQWKFSHVWSFKRAFSILKVWHHHSTRFVSLLKLQEKMSRAILFCLLFVANISAFVTYVKRSICSLPFMSNMNEIKLFFSSFICSKRWTGKSNFICSVQVHIQLDWFF